MYTTTLILGASGFIGNKITASFLNEGGRVIGIDISTNNDNIGNERYTHLAAPITEDVLQLVLSQNKIDNLVYAAGRASVHASFTSPLTDYHENVTTFFQVLESIRTISPETFVIFLSSAAVYGNVEKLPVEETDNTSPISPYGYHKLQSEIIASEFNRCFGIQTAVLRIFSCFGEGQRKLLLWDICEKASVIGEELLLKGQGIESRDFIHVDDVAAFISHIIRNNIRKTKVYNVGSGKDHSVEYVTKQILNELGDTKKISFEGLVNVGNPDNWRADISEMKATGFNPSISLEDGIRRYAQWYLNISKA